VHKYANVIVVDNNTVNDYFWCMLTKTLESIRTVGRPPADNPRNVQINFRIDQKTADDLDGELELERKPGLLLSRNDIARMLMTEALEARQTKRKKK
jgi:hypothetical protein